jgi:glycerol uptake facilitator-like aquaporin
MTLTRRLVAQGLGTALLLAVVVAQLLGAGAATLVFCWLYAPARSDAADGASVAPSEFVPHGSSDSKLP